MTRILLMLLLPKMMVLTTTTTRKKKTMLLLLQLLALLVVGELRRSVWMISSSSSQPPLLALVLVLALVRVTVLLTRPVATHHIAPPTATSPQLLGDCFCLRWSSPIAMTHCRYQSYQNRLGYSKVRVSKLSKYWYRMVVRGCGGWLS